MTQAILSRRRFLAGTAAAIGAGRIQIGFAQSKDTSTWTNWSGSVRCLPARIAAVDQEAALAQLVGGAARRKQAVRVAASGHSFVPVCSTTGTLVTLDGLKGMIGADREARTATFWAGSKIYELGDSLWAAGLAMENMGDIDRQSIAGAVSTGTHGTGKGIGSISTQVVGLRLVTADGEFLECSTQQDPELLHAAQVALGSLGVITQVTLKCLPAYNLHERQWEVPFEECVATMAENIAKTRHFEFFWRPQGDVCAMKSLHPTDAPPSDLPDRTGERIDRSYRIFPSARNNRFNEIEFAVPAENGVACLMELRDLMRNKHKDITWPLEYRTLAADNTLIGPASGRETIAISAHQAYDKPHQAFFTDVESIFRNHRGRPHWGKMHTHKADELAALYPHWDQFHAIRQRLDPHGRFLNQYLREIFPE